MAKKENSKVSPYAVVTTGGKQYRVSTGDRISVEKINTELGKTVTLDNVLLLGGEKVTTGTPLVKGASVSAKVIDHSRDSKVIIFKKKRRKGFRKKQGHRQWKTTLEVEKITAA